MAPRRAAEPVEEEEEEQEPQAGGLVFNEPLSWRASKPISVGVLLKRLNALSDELREMDQEDIVTESLTKVAGELVGQHLLGHKDKGVRAFTGCCLVDVLKLCAPNAPYTSSQLKDIFTFFITSILPSLSDPSSAYNTQHKYVLFSLAEVKSIVLLTDVPTADALTLHLFSCFFDIVSKSAKASTDESIAKDVEYNMSNILVTMVEESAQLPVTVVDVIVAQFLRASATGAKGKNGEVQDDKQSTLLPKELPEAYNMAKTICNSCPEKMARYVSQYFNEVILDVSIGPVHKPNAHKRKSSFGAEEEDELPTGPTDVEMRELEKAHNLLRELWRASPAVLQNVIPQLDAELSAENIELRLLATQTLGDIISGIGAAGPPPLPIMDAAAYPPAKLEDFPATPVSDSILTTPISPQSFATTHPAVYQNFLGRKNDKSPVIRSGWTTCVGRILVTSAGGIGLSPHEESALVKGLGEKLNDSDERVRLAAVRALGTFNFRDIMTKIATNGSVTKSGSVLCSFADRVRDRKPAVRAEGMNTIGRLWGIAAGEIAAGNDTVIEALGEIPTKIFDVWYANDMETNVLMDHVVFGQLIPLGYPPSKPKRSKSNGASQSQVNSDGPFDADRIRTERILLVVKSLNQKSLKAFFSMQARQPTYANVLTGFLKRCEEFNGGVPEGDAKDIRFKLDAIIDWLSKLTPDPAKSNSDLHKYAKLHDRRSYQLLRYAMAPENDFKTVNNAIKEFSKRIRDAPGAPAGIMDTLTPIIYRSASLVYNRSHNPVILQYSRSDEKGLGATAQRIINEISEKHPDIFKANVKELSKTLIDQAPTSTKANEGGSVDTLKALASFAKTHSEQIPRDRKFAQTLINYAQYGIPPRAAKYAVSVLLEITDKKEMHAKDLLEHSIQDWEYGTDHYLTKLATISQLILLDPKTTEDMADEILDITTAQVLLQTRTVATDDDVEWQNDTVLDEECQAKCWALKTLVNRLRTIDELEMAKKLATPIFKLLNNLIVNKGELSKQSSTPLHHRNRLRLLAAQLMLKLCTIKMFDELVSPTEFNRLALVAQDEFSQVRHGFVEKLQKYIVNNKLSNRFLTIIFITAFEPEQALKTSLVTWIRSRVKVAHTAKSKTFESIFPRLLHLLAHHPDYSERPEELRDNARYILYYLDTVATEDNIALIFKYAERVKQARDAVGPSSEGIYVYSDVAQSMIRLWIDKKGWTMQGWPVKVGLPIGIFAGLPSHEVAQEIAVKSYLPDDMDELLGELVRTSGNKLKKNKRKAEDKDGEPSAKKVKTSSSTKASKPKKERVVKEKKSPKPRKSILSLSNKNPVPDSERRKSGRGASARKSYAATGDSSDDDEMNLGVAEWEYENGEIVPDQPESYSDEEVEEEVGEDQEEDQEPPSDMDIDVEATPELEATPAVKKSKGKKATSKVIESENETTPEVVNDEEGAVPTPAVAKKSNTRAKKATRKISSEVVVEDDPTSDVVEDEEIQPLPAAQKSNARGKRATRKTSPEIDGGQDSVSRAAKEDFEAEVVLRRKTACAKGKKPARSPTPKVDAEADKEEDAPTRAPEKVITRGKRAVKKTAPDEEEEEAKSSPPKKMTTRGRKPAAKVPEVETEPVSDSELSEAEEEEQLEDAPSEASPPPKKTATKAKKATAVPTRVSKRTASSSTPKPKSKTPIGSASRSVPVRSRTATAATGKGKAKKDVFDMDDSA